MSARPTDLENRLRASGMRSSWPGVDLHVGIAALSLMLAATVIGWGDRLLRYVALNYNEGWNAYFIQRFLAGQALYPDRNELIVNNYPPLAFPVVGVVTAWIGDPIFAGRLVSVAAYVAIAVLIGGIVHGMVRSTAAAIFATMFYATLMAVFPGGRIGMNDPQMLAHAVMTAGLFVICRGHRRMAGLMGAAALMVAAGLMKHSLLAVPAAASIWLLVWRRADFGRWMIAGGVAAAIAFGMVFAAYGPSFVASMLSPRTFDLVRMAMRMQELVGLLQIPLAVWVAFVVVRGLDERSGLVTVYVLVSIAIGMFFLGGAGTSSNMLFDLVIALSIAMGLAVGRLGGRVRVAVLLALSLSLAVEMPAAPLRLLAGSYQSAEAQERETRADIDAIAARSGPVLCEMPQLCYWGGKSFELDTFNVTQLIATGALSQDVVLERIRAKRYSLIQLTSFASAGQGEPYISREIERAIDTHYRIDRTSRNGTFLLPRSE